MVWVRISISRWDPKDLHWMLGYFRGRGIRARMDMDLAGKFFVCREMDSEMAAYLDLLEDADRQVPIKSQDKLARSLFVESGGWGKVRSRE